MMKTQIEIKENNIVCTITSLEYDDINCNGRVYMTTKRVRKILVDSGHSPGKVIIESRVDNCNEKLQGTWVFENMLHTPPVEIKDTFIEEYPKKKTTTKQTRTSRRKTSRKSKKSLDNSHKDVIIEE